MAQADGFLELSGRAGEAVLVIWSIHARLHWRMDEELLVAARMEELLM